MNCPKCNKPNREKAVFCKWCGTNVVTKATEQLRELSLIHISEPTRRS